jgi:hypothetical protein
VLLYHTCRALATTIAYSFTESTASEVKWFCSAMESGWSTQRPVVSSVRSLHLIVVTILLCWSSDGNAVPTASGSSGGGIRHFSLHPRCLHHSEVSELTGALKQERKREVENLVSVYLQGMGMEAGIAAWAAREAEGATIEEKINSVLNLMPGALGGGGGGGMMGGDMDMDMGGYGGGF